MKGHKTNTSHSILDKWLIYRYETGKEHGEPGMYCCAKARKPSMTNGGMAKEPKNWSDVTKMVT